MVLASILGLLEHHASPFDPEEPVKLAIVDEFFDLVLKLNTLLCIVAMVMVV